MIVEQEDDKIKKAQSRVTLLSPSMSHNEGSNIIYLCNVSSTEERWHTKDVESHINKLRFTSSFVCV